mmetsp:Transcript_24250/g.57223  ORF Transcript_24250/g.57223 Transcript_24250/m.57223 type:complete len:725 (+) Transcript_24250:182-2356(+)
MAQTSADEPSAMSGDTADAKDTEKKDDSGSNDDDDDDDDNHAATEHPRKRAKTTDSSESSSASSSASSFRALSESILSPDLLERSASIREDYKSAKPYPHSQIRTVFRPEFLNACKDEIKAETKVNFKESDLFRVYQSIDFANLDPERAAAMKLDVTKFPTIAKLRDLLYSKEWRAMVETWAGLLPGTLIDKIDCACNCHAPGCHLLCHDDVIGTRKISYIIYLTEENWDGPTEGGALELYGPQTDEDENDKDKDMDNENSNNSTPVPVGRAWPIFNSMAFFEVLPGRSFHAVQEVTGDRPRLSLQGWYHAKDPPPQEELQKATLQQLKSLKPTFLEEEEKENEGDQKPPARGKAAETSSGDTDPDAFTDEDRTYLQKYIKHEYLSEDSMNDIQTKFENNSTIQFRNFLLPEWVPTIEANTYYESSKDEAAADKKAAAEKDSNDDNDSDQMEKHYQQGVTPEWRMRGPAHKQRYLTYVGTNDNDNDNDNEIASTEPNTKKGEAEGAPPPFNAIGALLETVRTKVFESQPFLRYLKRVTSLDKPTGILHDQVRRFRPGLDYTVAHYGLLMQRSVLDATMCFVKDDTDYDRAMWESGDTGGFECYIEADDEDLDDDHDAPAGSEAEGAKPKAKGAGAADEYNEEDDTELLSVSASNNTLSLVYRDPGTMRFVKYVSSSAPSSRYDICMEYDLPPDDEDDNDDEGEGEGEGAEHEEHDQEPEQQSDP